MYKHPMLSVKEAAALLGCDERWIRERLNQGQLKGEKKTIGLKEKWFVYKGEIDAALARKGVFPSASPEQAPADSAESTLYFDAGNKVEEVEAIDAQASSDSAGSGNNASIAELVRLIANEFAEKLDQQTQLSWQLKRELEEKERQLLLLPDLEKRAEEERQATASKQFEADALRKQLEAIQTEKRAADAVIATMMEDIEKLKTPWWKRMLSAQKQA